MQRDNCVRMPRPRRVLVVDDDGTYRSVLVQVLQGAGYDAVQAGGPGEVIRLLERGQRFDAIVCDVIMPRLSGRELQQVLDEWLPGQAGRMVLMSGDHSLLDSLGVAPEACLKKPFQGRELIDAVKRVCA